MNKQLELNLSSAIDQRNNVKKRIKDNIENGNYTLDELESIYRHIYVSTEKSKPLQKRSGYVYFIYKGTNPKLCEALNLEVNEQNFKIYKIGKSCSINVINRVTEQIDIPRFNKSKKYKRLDDPEDKNKKVIAVSNLLNYKVYSKLERDLHKKYSKNKLGKSEWFIGLTKYEIQEIKQILGGGISVKELRHL
tara:strand:- start:380 stop:955 length:576 start_codon:yes stop_codon:yes gene_type:complete